MSLFFKPLFLLFVICLGVNTAQAKKTLVVIGYNDKLTIEKTSDFFESFSTHKYNSTISTVFRQTVSKWASENSFRLDKPNLWMNDHGDTISLLDSNAACPQDKMTNDYFLRDNEVCESQKHRSQITKQFLLRNSHLFDEIIYLGHSRRGQGFALGPFLSENTFPVQFLMAPAYKGSLKKLTIISCKSNLYYRAVFQPFFQKNFEFFGFDDDVDFASMPNILIQALN